MPESLVAESAKKQVNTSYSGEDYGYGFLFWGGEHGSFRADGKHGQFSILMRDKNAVVTIVAESREAKDLLAAVFQHIYPQL